MFRVPRHFPRRACLICVLAKRRKEGMRRWMRKLQRDPKSKLRLKEITEQETQAILAQLRLYQKDARIGAIISSDDIPVHPKSLEGYNYFFLFRDTKSCKIFVFPSRTNDSKAYLRALGKVLSIFKRI
jgi:hypothetical protein